MINTGKITRYLTQDNADFPRPGVAFVPYAGGRWLHALRAVVAKFEKYHANIHWIFASRNHEDVLGTFSGHLCNVISVIDGHVNAPLDGYLSCEERHVFLKAEEVLKAERVPPRGTYSRNERIRFAIQDEGDKFCFLKKFLLVELLRHAYESLNNTFVEGCNHGNSDSILLDKRVDLILALSKSVYPTSYYAYAVHAPDAVCFFTSRARPQQPSFTSCWFVFFTLSFVLAPVAALSFFLLNVRARLLLGETPRTGPFILFFVSSYLGRSPTSPTRASCATVRIMIAAWAMGMFVLGQYTQTTITASRSVPAYSSQIKRLSELASRLEDGTIKLCVHSMMARLVHKFGGDTPELERVRHELRNCKYPCLHDDAKRTCIPLVQTGAYAMLHRRQFFLHDKGLSMGMAVGEEVLFSFFSWIPTHRKFPLRSPVAECCATTMATALPFARQGMPPRQAGYDRPRAQARAVGGPHLHNVITPAAPADRLLLDSSSTRRPRPVDVSGIHILCKASSVLKEAYGTLGLQSKRHENELFPDRNLGPALQSLVGYLDLTGLSSNL
ncbi:hypothetical protein HPB50_013580 [Hyalomma asiaticum]|uniref:Uncharacterized protein n=1 Tax=Hyalomma asiaticum TaxID=266040 RepID=A0ACB7TA37_HYAAI|nr:hypothetical protein HPB50_013580 [Hyalomma asiaticum]